MRWLQCMVTITTLTAPWSRSSHKLHVKSWSPPWSVRERAWAGTVSQATLRAGRVRDFWPPRLASISSLPDTKTLPRLPSGQTPGWARLLFLISSLFRSLSPSQFSTFGSCTDLRTNTRLHTRQFRETNFSATTTTTTPPPRPPRYSKSLGNINKLGDQHQKRRRSVATCKSTHSLFECSEGCFDIDIEANKSFGQFVTITTGPILC